MRYINVTSRKHAESVTSHLVPFVGKDGFLVNDSSDEKRAGTPFTLRNVQIEEWSVELGFYLSIELRFDDLSTVWILLKPEPSADIIARFGVEDKGDHIRFALVSRSRKTGAEMKTVLGFSKD